MQTLEGWGDSQYTIVAQDRHRNGIGGAAFVVTIIDAILEGSYHRFVCTSFFDENNEHSPALRRRIFIEQTSALDVTETAKANITFAQGNSWRGSDMFGRIIADAYEQQCLNDDFGPYSPWGV